MSSFYDAVMSKDCYLGNYRHAGYFNSCFYMLFPDDIVLSWTYFTSNPLNTHRTKFGDLSWTNCIYCLYFILKSQSYWLLYGSANINYTFASCTQKNKFAQWNKGHVWIAMSIYLRAIWNILWPVTRTYNKTDIYNWCTINRLSLETKMTRLWFT